MALGKRTLFLSYQRSSSADLARYLRDKLVALNVDVFFDVETLNAGRFADIIEREIINRAYFLVILTPTSLDSEWVRREIATALKHHRQIIPLTTQGFKFSQALPDEIKELADYSGIPYDYQAADLAIERIKKALGIEKRSNRWLLWTTLLIIAVLVIGIRALGIFPPPMQTATALSQTTAPTSESTATLAQVLATSSVIATTVTNTTVPSSAIPERMAVSISRQPDLLAICALKPGNLSKLILTFIGPNEIYELGKYFPDTNAATTNQCWCLQQENPIFPRPSQCTDANTSVLKRVGSEWRRAGIAISIDGKGYGICSAQPTLNSLYACALN